MNFVQRLRAEALKKQEHVRRDTLLSDQAADCSDSPVCIPPDVPVARNLKPAPAAITSISESAEKGTAALKLDLCWLTRILHFGKRMEIRHQDCKKYLNKTIYLANQQTIYGSARVIKTYNTTLEENRHMLAGRKRQHHVDDLSTIHYKEPWIWVLDDVKCFKEPIGFTTKK